MTNGTQVLEAAREEKLYAFLVSQLNKDFKRAGLDSTFDQVSSSEKLLRDLEAALYELVLSDFENYLTLLYAIDVSEAKIKALPDSEVHEFVQRVSVLILEREFKKVQFKNRTWQKA